MVLTKFRLNTFVLITTFFGFLIGVLSFSDGWSLSKGALLFHTLLGTAASAFGAAVFNQLLEIEQDARMERTADRPLPTKRMIPVRAFAIGWGLCAFGIIHLAAMVNLSTAILSAITIGTYVFVYTPMKQMTSLNTLVGAIPGAIPPLMGWTAVTGQWAAPQGWFLFALLFLWQLPHFVAINWCCRTEYEEAGYVMWCNGDVSGKKSSRLCIIFSLMLAALAFWPWFTQMTDLIFPITGGLLGIAMSFLAFKFWKTPERQTARTLFFFTLLYLPLALASLALSWNDSIVVP